MGHLLESVDTLSESLPTTVNVFEEISVETIMLHDEFSRRSNKRYTLPFSFIFGLVVQGIYVWMCG